MFTLNTIILQSPFPLVIDINLINVYGKQNEFVANLILGEKIVRDKKKDLGNHRYRLGANNITKEDIEALADWLKSEPTPQLTMGPLVKIYEEKWSQWIGRKYSVACNSGSSANLLMAYALLRAGRLKNKKVIVPSASWVTSIAPFIQLGFEPIMCEADPSNWGLDPVHLKELLQKHSPAIVMLVHVLGVPAHMEEIMHLKEKYDFLLLEDACAALGSSFNGQKVGTFGNMASASTYYGHQMATIEGGLVFTDDPALYNMLLMLRSHGWIAHLDQKTKTDLLAKHQIEDIGTDFVFVEPGFNFRLTETQAFLGLRQLCHLDWMIGNRSNNHQRYQHYLSNHLETQRYDHESVVCSIHFGALAKSYQQRNHVIKALDEAGIRTRPFTSGNQGRHPYWFNAYGLFSGTMANRLYECGFFLPNHPYLQAEDIEFISDTVLKSIAEAR